MLTKKKTTKPSTKSEEPSEDQKLEQNMVQQRSSEQLDLLVQENNLLRQQIQMMQQEQMLDNKATFNRLLLTELRNGFDSISRELKNQTKFQAMINDVEVENGTEEEETSE